MLSEVQYRCLGRYREAVIVLLLTVLAFAVRLYRVDFNSLSEDEVGEMGGRSRVSTRTLCRRQ